MSSERIQSECTIIGGGVIGMMVAYSYAKNRRHCRIFEKETLGGVNSTSYDYSKNFRTNYGGHKIYEKMARSAHGLWKELSAEVGTEVLIDNQNLYFSKDSNFSSSEFDLPRTESIRYPQYCNDNFQSIDSSCGVLRADIVLEYLADFCRSNEYISVHEHEAVRSIDGQGSQFFTEKGRYQYIGLVVAANIWSQRLVPGSKEYMRPTVQSVLYFQPESNAYADFAPETFPSFFHLDSGIYGFPMVGINAVKVADHTFGEEFDFQQLDSDIYFSEFEKKCRELFAEHIPGLINAKLIEKKMCHYDTTHNGDILIDQPFPNMHVVHTSGHGFKFSPVLGRILYCYSQGVDSEFPRVNFQKKYL